MRGVDTGLAKPDAPDPDARRWVVLLLLSTLLSVAWVWDISWQASVRQQTFGSPPHFTLLLCALAVGAATLGPTLRAPRLVVNTPRRWQLVVLAGAALAVGGIAVDLLWHERHSESTAVLSFPHAVIGLSVLVVLIGSLAIARERVAGDSGASGWQGLPVLHMWGLILLWTAVAATEYVARPNLWHGSEFYQVSAIIFPVTLVIASRSSDFPWAATVTAAIYMVVSLVMVWIFPVLPVQPRLDPGATVTTHIMTPAFPLLLVFPSIGMDLVLRAAGGGWRALMAIAGVAVSFVMVLLAVQWPFGDFLLSPIGRHYLFAADQWPYHAQPGAWQHAYWTVDGGTRTFARGLFLATLLAAASSGIGLALGNRLRTLPRYSLTR